MKRGKEKGNDLIRKMFFGSLLVLIFSSVSTMLGSLVDGIITSRFLGDGAMASFSIVSPVYNILMMLSGILSSGTQVAYTRLIGAGDTKRAKEVFNMCFFSALLLSFILAFVSLFGAKEICSLLGASGKSVDMLPMAAAYLRGFAIGFPANLLVPVLSGFMQIDGDRSRGMRATGLMTVTNITADLLNVFVFHGGMFGMALATSIANYAALIVLILHFTKKNIVLQISPKGLKPFDISEIIKNGLPNAISNGSLMLQKVVLNYLLLAVAGSWAVSALGKAFTFFGFVNTVLIGIGTSTMVISGILTGEEDKNGLKALQNLSLRCAVGSSFVAMLVIVSFTPVFVALFMSDTAGEAYTAAINVFRANAIALPFTAVNAVFLMHLQGIRNAFLSRLLSFLERAVYVIAFAFVLGMTFGVNGVWAALAAAEILTVATILLFALSGKKKAGSLREALLFLPEDFGVKDEDVLELAMASEAEVIRASETVQDFVMRRGGLRREHILLPLCLEEMAGNIIRFGFADGKKHHIEAKVIYKDQEWILRVKDDCDPFDPPKWLSIHQNEDKTANIGICMVMSLAKDVSYVSTMQMNNLIIRI